ncbi:hypothetical protein QL285_098045 [Trifolium repens]|nr:hypothetical protein QL285_098045 [Trifolium repens]
MPNAMPRPASQEKHDDHQFPHPKSISKASPGYAHESFSESGRATILLVKQASHVSKEVNGKRLACCSFHAKEGQGLPTVKNSSMFSPISSQILQNLTF